MYERWVANPESVEPAWRELFAAGGMADGDGQDGADGVVAAAAPPPAPEPAPAPAPAAEAPAPAPAAEAPAPAPAAEAPAPAPAAEEPAIEEPGEPIRGVGARIVANMAKSLEV